jgi:hypothetical protein
MDVCYSSATKPARFRPLLGSRVYFLTIVAVCFLAGESTRGDESEDRSVEFHGPGHPGYPNPFLLSYTLLESTLSPNKQFGVIFPKLLLEGSPDFIVDAKQSLVLGEVNTDEPYFEHKNRGGLDVYWSPDSSAVLVENAGRWEPDGLVLLELKDGKISRQTKLGDQLGKMFSPAIAKAEHRRNDPDNGGAYYDVKAVRWKKEGGLQLRISCDGYTNPKAFDTSSTWEGKLEAVYDLAHGGDQ